MQVTQVNPVKTLFQFGNIIFPGKERLSDLVVLNYRMNNAGAVTTYGTAKITTSAGTAYSVPAAKTLKIFAVRLAVIVAPGAGAYLSIGYGDTDVGWSSAAAPTTPKTRANVGWPSSIGFVATAVAAQAFGTTETYFEVPTAKFPALQLVAPAAVYDVICETYGVEV